MTRFFALLVLLMSLAAAAQQAPPQTGSVSGTLIDAATQQALPNARVALLPNRGIETNADGRGLFVLEGVDTGRQILIASSTGYSTLRKTLSVAAGQRVENVVFRLSRRGVITGRVLDPNGRPAVGARFTLLRFAFTNGNTSEAAKLGQANTTLGEFTFGGRDGAVDDQGNFRMTDVEPGAYYGRIIPPDDRSSLGAVLYPGVNDLSKAIPVHLNPGEELRLNTVTLAPSPLGLIRARLVDLTGETRPPFPGIGLSLHDVANRYVLRTDSPDAAETLTIRPDWHGRYRVCGGFAVTRSGLASESTPTEQRWNCVLVDYTGADISVDIRVGKAHGRISGRALLESAAGAPLAPFRGLQVSGETENPDANPLRFGSDADGTLSSSLGTSWHEGRGYITSFLFLPVTGDYYVESVRQAARDVLKEGLVISSAVSPMEIVVSAAGGIVGGRVLGADGKAVPHATVVLVPQGAVASRPDRSSIYRTTEADQNGGYEFRALVPGEYQAYAAITTRGDDLPYWDAPSMKRYEANSRAIRIEKGRKYEGMNLTLIER
jgi:protocatechuate 3,4-dioxygenase beta subunit